VCGDFNGHISNGEDGVLGNHFGTNPNGDRLVEFATRNNLKNINTKKSLPKEKWRAFAREFGQDNLKQEKV
jgi:hypothetical protein